MQTFTPRFLFLNLTAALGGQNEDSPLHSWCCLYSGWTKQRRHNAAPALCDLREHTSILEAKKAGEVLDNKAP